LQYRQNFFSYTNDDVILSERDPERFWGPEERFLLFGVGSGVVSEESAFVFRHLSGRARQRFAGAVILNEQRRKRRTKKQEHQPLCFSNSELRTHNSELAASVARLYID
jgi:hypothetical protein